MPDAVFVVQLDDLQGFVVQKRHPTTLILSEKKLNLIFYEHQQDIEESLKVSEIEDMQIASYWDERHPGWFVCYVLRPDDDVEMIREDLTSSARFILELMKEAPDRVDLGEILQRGSGLEVLSEEQLFASIFLTPSTALLLEKMQEEGVERAAKLGIWLKDQIQSETIELREAMAPLMDAGIVKVEMIGKTAEVVFLLKDVFSYRAPPVDSLSFALQSFPGIVEDYKQRVGAFFTPPPPSKGYNPTLPVDDPNSPIMEDRRKLSGILVKSLYYKILKALRSRPMTLAELEEKTGLPNEVLGSVLWTFESERIATQFKEQELWALVTNPTIEAFFPEYVLPLVSTKISEKQISQEIASRYLDHLGRTWSEPA
ncbi:MAG: hypothetical protein JSW61_09580 [Candidatus Thorarchaeota archaeon]|nr:MAG: hypothetical protein JSW61_09580 [Candidatus Thorarchaeota archaeon]